MTSASAESARQLGEGSIVSKYRIVRKLGAGEMGEVYEAQRVSDGGRIALKVVHPKADGRTEVLRRFHREATLCAGLRHPNIVPVIDYGVWEGMPFLVMPILYGTDLDRLIERIGPFSADVAVAIALGAARGLEHAHHASIVHRDFKPANLFLDEGPDGAVTPVVCDFGVAKAIDSSTDGGGITATGAVIGTPLYMAPEQLLDSKRVDERCDVWSLGMTVYHMLAGRAAFINLRTFGELLLAMRDERVPPLQALAPWVPPSLARIVHAMLLPVGRRIATITEVVSALERFRLSRGARGIEHVSMSMLVPMSPNEKALVETQALVPQSGKDLANPESEPEGEAAPIAERPDPFLGRTLNRRYVIGSRLGLGGMGAVYEAMDMAASSSSTGGSGSGPRDVALKVMLFDHLGHDPEGLKRFLREAKAAGRIASPYVTQVLDTGVDETTQAPFLVMERLRGNDLAALLQREGCGLEPEPVVSLFLHACDALASAHALGIVHRDIKPSNLFVHDVGDGSGNVVLKICDFGIAKQLTQAGAPEASAELTRTGGLLGSPLYMSPEQAKSAKNVDGRSDIFSLALSLHEALCGQRPWPGRTSMGEIIVAVCTEDVPPLIEAAPWIDPRLDQVLQRGLARDVAARWQSIAEFANALRPFGLGRSVRSNEVVGIAPERASARSLHASAGGSASASGAMASSARPFEVSTSSAMINQPVAITYNAPPRSKAAPIIAAFSVAAFIAVCGGGLYVAKDKLGRSPSARSESVVKPESTGAKPDTTMKPDTSASTSASIEKDPLASPTASMGVDAAGASGIAVKPTTGRATTAQGSLVPAAGSRTTTATTTATTTSAVPSSAGSVGRGMTATDLPP